MSVAQKDYLLVGGPFDGARVPLSRASITGHFLELHTRLDMVYIPPVPEGADPMQSQARELVTYHLQQINTDIGPMFVYSVNPSPAGLARMLIAGYRKEHSA